MPFTLDHYTREAKLIELIKKANAFFKQEKSSLAPVLAARSQPQTLRLSAMQNAVSQMPLEKKNKYRSVLAFLELEYAGGKLGVPQPPSPSGLKTEKKTGWREGTLTQATTLAHCTGTPPNLVMVNGADPQRSREWCLPAEANPPKWDAPIWKWNRFVFLFLLDPTDFPPKGAQFFGFTSDTGYIYIATIPRGTTFMSENGTVTRSKEIAFPELVKPDWIIGIFQYRTGLLDNPPRNPARGKTDYTLTQLDPQPPHGVLTTAEGSDKQGSTNSSGTAVKQLLNLP